MRRDELRGMWRDAKRNLRATDPTYTLRVNLWRRFKMTLEEYDAMNATQRGLCAICQRPETRSVNGVVQRLSVDHNHTTGQRRQLLCSNCNPALGLVGEDIETLQRMIVYLKRHGGKHDPRQLPEVVPST